VPETLPSNDGMVTVEMFELGDMLHPDFDMPVLQENLGGQPDFAPSTQRWELHIMNQPINLLCCHRQFSLNSPHSMIVGWGNAFLRRYALKCKNGKKPLEQFH
jgi:hypothetical protein